LQVSRHGYQDGAQGANAEMGVFGMVTWCWLGSSQVMRMWLPVWRVTRYPTRANALAGSSPLRSLGSLIGR